MNKLISEISQLSTVSPEVLQRILREISYTNINWKEEYSEYQTSGWKTAPLINPSGNANNALVEDGAGRETELLSKMPFTRDFLASLNLSYLMVRIANLEPSSFLWEHRDYAELDNRKKVRLHIPISTNEKSYLIINRTKVFMNTGYIWKLDPTSPHGVCNRGKSNRIHLLLDCYMDEDLNTLFLSEFLNSDYCSVMDEEEDPTFLFKKAKILVLLNFATTAEKLLLKRFHSISQKEGFSYDLVIKLYQELGMESSEQLWRSKKQKFLAIS